MLEFFLIQSREHFLSLSLRQIGMPGGHAVASRVKYKRLAVERLVLRDLSNENDVVAPIVALHGATHEVRDGALQQWTARRPLGAVDTRKSVRQRSRELT